MYSGLFLLCVVSVAHTKPSVVERFEVQPTNLRLSYEPYDVTWNQFKKEHGKEYKSDEEEKARQVIFMDNLQRIEQHNRLYLTKQSSYYMGVNRFADMTVEEYRKYNKLYTQTAGKSHGFFCPLLSPRPNATLPDHVDWRAKGYVTPVKDQGTCGSSWAYSVAGALEGQHFNRTGQLVSLSEQQLIDCSRGFGNEGCEGGFIFPTYKYIYSAGGLESEKDYPYTAHEGSCVFNKSNAVARISACKAIIRGSETILRQAVATVGPVVVAIDASLDSFSKYAGGVYDDTNCSSTLVDHGMLAVGYGSHEGKEYWLVKNSWGTKWGLDGYVMMARNDNDLCGIAWDATFPLD